VSVLLLGAASRKAWTEAREMSTETPAVATVTKGLPQTRNARSDGEKSRVTERSLKAAMRWGAARRHTTGTRR
jgi:hypothetical protein